MFSCQTWCSAVGPSFFLYDCSPLIFFRKFLSNVLVVLHSPHPEIQRNISSLITKVFQMQWNPLKQNRKDHKILRYRQVLFLKVRHLTTAIKIKPYFRYTKVKFSHILLYKTCGEKNRLFIFISLKNTNKIVTPTVFQFEMI